MPVWCFGERFAGKVLFVDAEFVEFLKGFDYERVM
jgi:hypothetical protein